MILYIHDLPVVVRSTHGHMQETLISCRTSQQPQPQNHHHAVTIESCAGLSAETPMHSCSKPQSCSDLTLQACLTPAAPFSGSKMKTSMLLQVVATHSNQHNTPSCHTKSLYHGLLLMHSRSCVFVNCWMPHPTTMVAM